MAAVGNPYEERKGGELLRRTLKMEEVY